MLAEQGTSSAVLVNAKLYFTGRTIVGSCRKIFILYNILMNKTLKGNCESCLMPFAKDPKGENRENEKYCSYCFTNGSLCYPGNDVKEFKKVMMDLFS